MKVPDPRFRVCAKFRVGNVSLCGADTPVREGSYQGFSGLYEDSSFVVGRASAARCVGFAARVSYSAGFQRGTVETMPRYGFQAPRERHEERPTDGDFPT